MTLRFVASCGLLFAALTFAGCDSGRQPPAKVSVQVVNVAPGFANLTFRREQEDTRLDMVLAFRDAQAAVYDADSYDFNVFERTLSNADPGRTWTFAQKLESNTHYTFVLTEVAGEVQPVVLASPPLPASDAQIVALNAASGLPAIDLYLERSGVGIAGATPRGTFSAQEQLAPLNLPSGDYQLFLTTAGNPADVLLTSSAFNLTAGTTSSLVVANDGGQGTARVSALLLGGTPVVLFDVNAPSELRAINAATDQAPRDLAIDSQFSPPLFSAMPFGETTAYARVPIGSVKVNVTPVGNPGVLEIDTSLTGFTGQRATMLFSGPAGALLPIFTADDGRRFNREAKVRFMNAASQFLAVDFVLTFPDADPARSAPVSQLFPPGISDYVPLYPGDYDLYLYQSGTLTVISGPTRISVAARGIYGALAIDGPDTATANVRLLDDFIP